MLLKTMCAETRADYSEMVEWVFLELNGGKKIQIVEERDTGKVYIITFNKSLRLDSKTANFAYIEIDD